MERVGMGVEVGTGVENVGVGVEHHCLGCWKRVLDVD